MVDEQKEYDSYAEMFKDLRENDPKKLQEFQRAFNAVLVREGMKPIPFGLDLTKLKTLESYTDEEKLQVFERFYNYAKEILKAKAIGEEEKDTEHWCFEMIMELLGKEVWDVYNNLG